MRHGWFHPSLIFRLWQLPDTDPLVYRRFFLLPLHALILLCGLAVSCVPGSLSFLGLPCENSADCGEKFICYKKFCRESPDEPPACLKDAHCPDCHRCNDKQVCVAFSCSSDTDCQSCAQAVCDTTKGICVANTVIQPVCQKHEDCESRLCVKGRCLVCKEDRDCPNNRCKSGRCIQCADDRDCPSNLCDNDICKSCQANENCRNGLLCKDKICVKCSSHTECTSRLCVDGGCKPCAKDVDCPDGLLCRDKICTPCATNADCASFLCVNGACRNCTTQTDCGSGECQNGRCAATCQQHSDCSTNLCVQNRCLACKEADDCKESLRCIDSRCANPCRSTAECLTGRICVSGKCQLPQEGEICSSLVGCAQTLSCINESGTTRCRQTCDPLNTTNNCPAGQFCAFQPSDDLDRNGICKPSNNGNKLGQACDDNGPKCEVDLVCKTDGKDKLCRKLCDTQQAKSCADTEICVGIDTQRPRFGVCLPSICKGSVGNCATGQRCYQDACRPSCDPAKQPTTCTGNTFCQSLSAGEGGGGVCLEKQCGNNDLTCNISNYCKDFQCLAISPAPKVCTSHSDCLSTELCISSSSSSQTGTCREKCVLKQGTPCSSKPEHLCIPLPNPSTTAYAVCLPKRGGGDTGASCAAGTRFCERSHFCTPVTEKRSLCLFLCSLDPASPPGDSQCPTGFRCLLKINDSSLGICIASKTLRVDEECGPSLGVCPTQHSCVVDTATDKAFCRKDCTSDLGCSNTQTCQSVKRTIDASAAKVCLP